MELNLKNPNLKILDQKLIPNPSQKNVSSPLPAPNPVTPNSNSLVENQDNDIFYGDSLLRGWSKTGKRTTPGKTILNRHPAKENPPLNKRKPVFHTSSNTENIYGQCSSNIVHKNHSEIPKQYACNICRRSCKCYQALGGHKVHHKRKVPGVIAESMVRYSEQSEEHICQFCNKVFSSGQALGGHKRHCREPVRVKEAPCTGEIQEKEIQKRRLSFDMNELPEEMEDSIDHK